MKRIKLHLKVVAPTGGYAARLLNVISDAGYTVDVTKAMSSGVVEVEVLVPYGETDSATGIARLRGQR